MIWELTKRERNKNLPTFSLYYSSHSMLLFFFFSFYLEIFLDLSYLNPFLDLECSLHQKLSVLGQIVSHRLYSFS